MSASNPSDGNRQERVLVLTPSASDAAVLSEALLVLSGIEAIVCDNVADLCQQIDDGAGAAIIAEEGLSGEGLDRLAASLKAQPEWSDFPLILLLVPGGDRRDVWQLLRGELAASLTLLQRPLHKAALVSSVRTVLQSRRRQHQIRDELIERRRLTDAPPVLIAHIDDRERYLFANRRYEEWFGIPRDEIIGKTVREILGEDAYRTEAPYIRRALRGDEIEFENHIVLRDLRRRVTLTHMVPESNQAGTGFYLAATDITERKRVEEALGENERRLRLALEAGQMGLWDWDVRTQRSFWNRREFELLGMTPREGPVNPNEFYARVHPDDIRLVRGLLTTALRNRTEFSHEFRIIHPNGEVRWLRGIGRVYCDENNCPLQMVGVNFDVTERKTTEEGARQAAAAQALSIGLIRGQEEERERISRDLHDDFAQRIAVLAMDLDKFSLETSESRARIPPLQKRVGELCEDVRRLSHQLHPPLLDQLGLAVALESECDNLSVLTNFSVQFHSEGSIEDISKDCKLCLYRIAQEALHNVVKHANATSVEVILSRDKDKVRLLIRDDGIGFDLNAKRDNATLGLYAMEERLRPFQGTLSIRSQPGSGTRIEASIALVNIKPELAASI